MNLEELEARLEDQLGLLGFVCGEAIRDGPMGSALVRYSSGRADFTIHSDRGLLGITMGAPGSVTYGCQPWADVLGLVVEADLDATAQADFFLGNARQIENALEGDPNIQGRLRTSNWRLVKDRLGLDPDMRIPGETRGV